jgi:hypothetical protein
MRSFRVLNHKFLHREKELIFCLHQQIFFSSPPLKKKVTWGYFSVSAIRNCVLPALEIISPKLFLIAIGLKIGVAFF